MANTSQTTDILSNPKKDYKLINESSINDFKAKSLIKSDDLNSNNKVFIDAINNIAGLALQFDYPDITKVQGRVLETLSLLPSLSAMTTKNNGDNYLVINNSVNTNGGTPTTNTGNNVQTSDYMFRVYRFLIDATGAKVWQVVNYGVLPSSLEKVLKFKTGQILGDTEIDGTSNITLLTKAAILIITNAIQSQVDTNKTNIANNTTEINTNKTNIANNTTEINDNKAKITTLEGQVSTIESDVQQNTNDINANTTKINNNETKINQNTQALDGKLNTTLDNAQIDPIHNGEFVKIVNGGLAYGMPGPGTSATFKDGSNPNDYTINGGAKDQALLTQKKIEDDYTIPINTKIDTNKTNVATNTTNIGDNLTKINANINDITQNINKISAVQKQADDNEKAITTLNTSKVNIQLDNTQIDTTYVDQYLKVGTNGGITFDTPSGGDECAKKDLSNIISIATKIANMITSQANEFGDDTISEVKINTIYTDLTINGRGVFVNGNRIDSSMEWKDITNTWKTRNWSKDDVGKQVRITTGNYLGNVMSAILMWDNAMMEMVFCYQFFAVDAIGQRINYGYWRSSYVGTDNVISTSMLWNASTTSPLVNVRGSEPGWNEITKFEIFENANAPEPKLTLTFDNYKQYTTWDNIGGLIIDNRIQQISSVFMTGYIPDPTKPTESVDIYDLTLPNQLEVIDANAFWSSKINYLIIPDNTVAIGDSAFEKANILTLTLGTNVISIGYKAFQNSVMKSLSIPNNVVNIDSNAFKSAQLTTLRLDQNVKTIGQYAFAGSPLDELHIGLQVEKIGDLAFSSIVNAHNTKVYLPAKFNGDDRKDRIFGENNWDQITFLLPTLILDNTNYQQYTTYDTTTKQLQILRPITEITNVFQNGYPDGSGTNLPIEILNLPNSLYKIDNNAFKNCRNLTQLYLGNSVKIIGNWAFQYTKLTQLTIPNNVETIGDLTFANVNTLTTLTLGNNVKTIGTQAFYYAKLTSLEIPDSVITIGNRAFTNSYLNSLTLGNSLETIVEWAFKETRITSLVFPSTLKSIGTGAFLRAPLTHLEIPNSCNHIDSKAFSSIVNNSSTTVSMPSSFNTKKQKDSIFNKHWNNITFTWT